MGISHRLTKGLCACLCAFAYSAASGALFTDNFDSGASPLWGNESGAWSAAGGVYSATAPDNIPNAYSALPFLMTDLTLDVDINSIADGGVWLHSAVAEATSIGRKGVLLVTGPGGALYWHVVADGSSYGSSLNSSGNILTPGNDYTITVDVDGNTFSAYVDGSPTAATTLNTAAFSSGEVALYDNSAQTFDNFSVTFVPEPGAYALLAGLAILGAVTLRRRR